MGENMFTPEEMGLLYEKATNFVNSPMAPINFIYRDKSQEYFDEIDKNAQINGKDKIMQSYTKNQSGHPECPIIVDQIEGLYFSTSCDSRGSPLPSSHFGPRRMSVSAEYLLDAKRYSLFFADFYCARYTGEYHKVTLALCEIGSKQEFFCREHLIKLDIGNNPFLQCIHGPSGRAQCSVATYKNCPIYLFLCADFNISNCLNIGKCHFSTVDLVGFGISEHKLAFGQTYDSRCGTCGIRNLESFANTISQLTATVANIDIGQPNDANDWRIWKFDCGDLPHVCPICKARMEKILLCNAANELSCQLCRRFLAMHKDANESFCVISDERWPTYIKETETVFHNVPNIVEAIKSSKDFMWPSQMGQVGIGIFRQGIVPDCDQHSQRNGGYFHMLFFENVGNHDGKMDKLDQIFNSFLQLAFGGGLAKEELRSVVSGIFVRAEIYMRPDGKHSHIPDDLPAKFRFELWIRDRSIKDNFLAYLKKWTAEVVRGEFGYDQNTTFKFVK